jgi:glycosyltransferase involved in cell wall biosynthesis
LVDDFLEFFTFMKDGFMSYPCITIVTPSLNNGKYLEETIRSVVDQNYPNLEYIIIDGGSTDDSVRIIEKYERFLGYWCSEPDNGMYDALRKGFSRSKGQIMGWINSDDLLFPWTLRTLAEIFINFPEIEWLSSLYPCTLNTNGTLYKTGIKKGYARKYFLNGLYLYVPGRRCLDFIQQESTFWKRSLYERAGGIKTNFRYAGDFDLWTRFFGHSELYGIGCMLGGFRHHDATQLSLKYFDQYLNEAYQSLHQVGGALCSPFRGWLLSKFMWIISNYSQLKRLFPGLCQGVHNIRWSKKDNEWIKSKEWI